MSDQLEPELERVARLLANAGPLPDAPATLRERTLAIPDGGPVSAADLVLIAHRPRRRPRAAVLLGVAAAVAAIAIVPTALFVSRGDDAHRVALESRGFAAQSGGDARLVTHGDGSTTIELHVWKLPRPGSGRTYEAWLGRTGDRLSLGTFRIDSGGTAWVSWRVNQNDMSGYKWLWVTREPVGGGKAPGDRTALWGPLA
jgi:Anti-sigma-K factor rskA